MREMLTTTVALQLQSPLPFRTQHHLLRENLRHSHLRHSQLLVMDHVFQTQRKHRMFPHEHPEHHPMSRTSRKNMTAHVMTFQDIRRSTVNVVDARKPAPLSHDASHNCALDVSCPDLQERTMQEPSLDKPLSHLIRLRMSQDARHATRTNVWHMETSPESVCGHSQ